MAVSFTGDQHHSKKQPVLYKKITIPFLFLFQVISFVCMAQEKLDKIDDEQPALLSLAVFIGKTRLIDNVLLGESQQNAASAKA